jgi:hypothetical protein
MLDPLTLDQLRILIAVAETRQLLGRGAPASACPVRGKPVHGRATKNCCQLPRVHKACIEPPMVLPR